MNPDVGNDKVLIPLDMDKPIRTVQVEKKIE